MILQTSSKIPGGIGIFFSTQGVCGTTGISTGGQYSLNFPLSAAVHAKDADRPRAAPGRGLAPGLVAFPAAAARLRGDQPGQHARLRVAPAADAADNADDADADGVAVGQPARHAQRHAQPEPRPRRPRPGIHGHERRARLLVVNANVNVNVSLCARARARRGRFDQNNRFRHWI